MSERLKLWERERDRIASLVRHDRMDARVGVAMLAEIDQRIAEHRDGIVPAEAEQSESQAVLAVSELPANVAQLESGEGGQHSHTMTRDHQRAANRAHAAKMRQVGECAYRAAYMRTSRKPPRGVSDTPVALFASAFEFGQAPGPIGALLPLGLSDYFAERRAKALAMCAETRAACGGNCNGS